MTNGAINLMSKKRLLKKTVIDKHEMPAKFPDKRNYANLRDILATCEYLAIKRDPKKYIGKIFDACFNRINVLMSSKKRIHKDDLYKKIHLTILATELCERRWKSKYPRGKRYARLSNVLNTSKIQRVRERKQEILNNIISTVLEGCLKSKMIKREGNFYKAYPSKDLPKYINDNFV